MLTKKKKLSKKEIKEDKLVSFYYKAYGYIEKNSTRMLVYAGALIVLIAAVFFYLHNKGINNDKAGVELSRVMDLYNNGSYLEAIEGRQGTSNIGLKKIVEDYGNTENGETAKIFLANSYNRLGKTEDAYNYYKDYSGSIQMYQAAALAGQAGYFADKKDYEKAADLYKKASRVSNTDVLNPDYLLQAAINYRDAGRQEEAKNMLEKIKTDYKTSPVSREADKYMAEVNM